MRRTIKQWAGLLLCICLLIGPIAGMAADEDGDVYSLREKMLNQLQLSGFKGAFRMVVEGDAEWVKTLSPYSGATVQFEGLNTSAGFEYVLTASQGKHNTGKTEIYGNKKNTYVRSALLPGVTLRMDTHEDFITTLKRVDATGNPSLYSALLLLCGRDNDLLKLSTSVQTALQKWLEGYASTPEVVVQDGETLLVARYTISEKEIQNGLKSILSSLLASKEVLEVFQAQMTKEQAALYMNPDNMWYYEQVIDSLRFSEPLTMTRIVNTLGEERGTSLTLPMYKGSEIQKIEITYTGEANTVLVYSERYQLTWTAKAKTPKNQFAGQFALIPKEGEAIAFNYSLTKTESTSQDDSGFDHEITNWTGTLSKDDAFISEHTTEAAQWVQLEPTKVLMKIDYYSKQAKRDATTLDIEFGFQSDSATFKAAFRVKPVSPWDLKKRKTGKTVDAASLSPEERSELINDFFTNAALSLSDAVAVETVKTTPGP